MNANAMIAMFEKSRDEQKGLTMFLPGHKVSIVVTEIHGTEAVEGANQEYDRVLIPTDQVVALAFQ